MSSGKLPESDSEYLVSKGYTFEIQESQNKMYLIIKDYEFPELYTPNEANLLIIIPAGFPNSNPDMFWSFPDIKLKNGSWPKSSNVHENHLGQSWQRWSRHFPKDKWRPGIDGIKTYLGSIRKELNKGI